MERKSHLAVMHNGGLRSLVAATLLICDTPAPRLTLIHIDDGRDARLTRRNFMRKQALALNITRITELAIPHLFGHGYGRAPDGGPLGQLTRPQLLLAAIAEARYQQAEAVVWPVSVNGDATQGAIATEQAVLCEHLAQNEAESSPRIETPLAEMTDQQVIELGGQLGVDWSLAWSCSRPGETPCQACGGCRQRAQAFEKAGVIDPLLEVANASR
ncbi:MAG: 7-cyano-7-deazaguanine synthase [Phycisphaeraceae bacterium]